MEDSQDMEQTSFSKLTTQLRFLPNKSEESNHRLHEQPQLKDIYPQVIATCIAHMLVIQAGINMAYSAIFLPQVMADDSTIHIDKNQASWIASLMAIATPVGALVCGPFMDLLGRRLFSVIATVPITLSWFIMVFTPNSVWLLYTARVLAGFGGGLTTVSLVYISEITNAAWRPMLLCLNSVFVSLGILLTNVLGVCLPWRYVALVAGCLALTSAIAILAYNPESPYWLLTFSSSDKNFELAKKSLQSLNPNQQMFAVEWDRLLTLSQEKRTKESEEKQDCGLIGKAKLSTAVFFNRSSLLPIALLLSIFLFQQLSGIYPIIFYAVQIFQSIGGQFGAGLDENSATVLLGVIRFVMSVLTAGLSRVFGRRPLLIISGAGMTISSLVTAIYLHKTCVFTNVFNQNQTVLNQVNPLNLTNFRFHLNNISDSSNPIPIETSVDHFDNLVGLIAILVFVSMSSLGFLVIPWTLIGEILPLTVRGIGGGLLISFAYILMFGVVKVFPYMLDVFNLSGCFYFFSFTSLINVMIVYFFLPETLGKSFEEIGNFFVKPGISMYSRHS